jgi:hypothetical protein
MLPAILHYNKKEPQWQLYKNFDMTFLFFNLIYYKNNDSAHHSRN